MHSSVCVLVSDNRECICCCCIVNITVYRKCRCVEPGQLVNGAAVPERDCWLVSHCNRQFPMDNGTNTDADDLSVDSLLLNSIVTNACVNSHRPHSVHKIRGKIGLGTFALHAVQNGARHVCQYARLRSIRRAIKIIFQYLIKVLNNLLCRQHDRYNARWRTDIIWCLSAINSIIQIQSNVGRVSNRSHMRFGRLQWPSSG